MAYPNFEAEKARKSLTLEMIASDPRIDCTVSTLSLKLNGKFALTFPEALAIKDILGVDIPLEVLFEEKSND